MWSANTVSEIASLLFNETLVTPQSKLYSIQGWINRKIAFLRLRSERASVSTHVWDGKSTITNNFDDVIRMPTEAKNWSWNFTERSSEALTLGDKWDVMRAFFFVWLFPPPRLSDFRYSTVVIKSAWLVCFSWNKYNTRERSESRLVVTEKENCYIIWELLSAFKTFRSWVFTFPSSCWLEPFHSSARTNGFREMKFITMKLSSDFITSRVEEERAQHRSPKNKLKRFDFNSHMPRIISDTYFHSHGTRDAAALSLVRWHDEDWSKDGIGFVGRLI